MTEFSNHIAILLSIQGYPFIGKGYISDQKELDIIVDGLEKNELLDYDYLITGFIFSESFLLCVQRVLEKIRKVNPNVKYVCDPVLGDNGKLYVPEGLIEIYIDKLISKAWLITPNQFEAERLTCTTIQNKEDAMKALKLLQKMGPQIVILSSAEIMEYPNKLCCFCLSENKLTMLVIPKLEGNFTGTGDCLTALLLIWTHKLGDAGAAFVKSISTMYKIIESTIEIQGKNISDCMSKKYQSEKVLNPIKSEHEVALSAAEKVRYSELLIIPCKMVIENPPNVESILIEESILQTN